MAIFFKSKDKRVRALVSKIELAKNCFRFFIRNAALSEKEKYLVTAFCGVSLKKLISLSMRTRNRCVITGRSGSVFRDFRVSRITLKDLASRGYLTGVRKSS